MTSLTRPTPMADRVDRTPAVASTAGAKAGPRGQQVIETLRSAIISGRFEPGERLIESRSRRSSARAAARSARRSASSRTRAS